jgi:hypothetical protein
LWWLDQTHAKNGFEVTTHNVSDVPAERKKPGMVAGSSGMESDEKPEHYDTLLVHTDGTTRIFARH